MSGGKAVIADDSLPEAVLDRLRQDNPVHTTRRTCFPYAFACPAGVMRRNGLNSGCTEIMSPWGDAVHETELAK